jgi:hypothetical protein
LFDRVGEPARTRASAGLALTPTIPEGANPMVEAMQAYHLKVLDAIRCLAENYARQEAKEQIGGRGEKISDYAPHDINIMAHVLLVQRSEPCRRRKDESQNRRSLDQQPDNDSESCQPQAPECSPRGVQRSRFPAAPRSRQACLSLRRRTCFSISVALAGKIAGKGNKPRQPARSGRQ